MAIKKQVVQFSVVYNDLEGELDLESIVSDFLYQEDGALEWDSKVLKKEEMSAKLD